MGRGEKGGGKKGGGKHSCPCVAARHSQAVGSASRPAVVPPAGRHTQPPCLSCPANRQVIYIAPLKALVRERIKDWGQGFCRALGKRMVELTGDYTPDMVRGAKREGRAACV